MRLTQFREVALPAGDKQDAFTAQARAALVNLPGGGAFDQDGAAYIGQAVQLAVSLTLYDTETASIEAQFSTLVTALARGRALLRAEDRDGTRLQTWAKATAIQHPRNPGDLGLQKVSLVFSLPYPFWLYSDDEPVYLDDGLVLDDGWYLDSGHKTSVSLATTTTSLTLTNTGEVALTRSRLLLVPDAGAALTNLVIVNHTTGERVSWTGTLSAGEVLELDFGTETIRLNAVDDYASLDKPTRQLRWLTLALGANNITISTDNLTGTVAAHWYWSRQAVR